MGTSRDAGVDLWALKGDGVVERPDGRTTPIWGGGRTTPGWGGGRMTSGGWTAWTHRSLRALLAEVCTSAAPTQTGRGPFTRGTPLASYLSSPGARSATTPTVTRRVCENYMSDRA